METKPIYKSITFWGALAYTLGQFAESQGLVPSGTLANAWQALSGLLTVFGLRRAIG